MMMRKFAVSLVESFWFVGAILVAISVDVVLIGVQASEYTGVKAEWYIAVINQLFLAVYQCEIVLQIYAWRQSFFRNWWNNFNLTLIIVDTIGIFIPLIVESVVKFDTGFFRALRILKIFRALRALRILRTIRFLKNLQVIVMTLLKSIPAIGAILITISLVVYVFAIIGRDLYGKADPSKYGNIAIAAFSLFQLMTLDDWFEMHSIILAEHKHVLVFLILFIIIETLVFLNLFVAVIVDNLARAQSVASFSTNQQENDEKNDIGTEENNYLDDLKALHCLSQDLTSTSNTTEIYLKNLVLLEKRYGVTCKHRITLDKLVDMVDLSKT